MAEDVEAPARDGAVGPHPAGMVRTRADGDKGVARWRGLAIFVKTPARDRPINPQCTGVSPASTDGGEVAIWRRHRRSACGDHAGRQYRDAKQTHRGSRFTVWHHEAWSDVRAILCPCPAAFSREGRSQQTNRQRRCGSTCCEKAGSSDVRHTDPSMRLL